MRKTDLILFTCPWTKQYFQLDPKSYSPHMATHECGLFTEANWILKKLNMNLPTLRLFKRGWAMNFKRENAPLQWRGEGGTNFTKQSNVASLMGSWLACATFVMQHKYIWQCLHEVSFPKPSFCIWSYLQT